MKHSDLMAIDDEQHCHEQFKTQSQTKPPQDPLNTFVCLICNLNKKCLQIEFNHVKISIIH